jgi:hypothetical protein
VKQKKESEFKRKFRTYLLAWPFLLALNALANPKSANFSTPFFVISTFAAFMSLCRI